jgi:hypothetical protein
MRKKSKYILGLTTNAIKAAFVLLYTAQRILLRQQWFTFQLFIGRLSPRDFFDWTTEP